MRAAPKFSRKLYVQDMKLKSRGFTLIELLVVIAIIGILSSVVLASLNGARRKGRDARRIADVKQLQLALELYYDSNSGSYAPNLAALAPLYIAAVPTDPGSGAAYQYDDLTSTNTACTANPPTVRCQSYALGATLEDTTNSALASDIDPTTGTITCADPVFCVQP